jgi:hypothetical protein
MFKFIQKPFKKQPNGCIASKFNDGELWFFVKKKNSNHLDHWTTNIHHATRFSSDKELWKYPFLENFLEGRSHDLSFYPSNLDLASQEIKDEWLLPE